MAPSHQDNPLHHPNHSQHLYIFLTISIRHNIPNTIFHTSHTDDISSLSSHLSRNPEAVLPAIFTLKISSELFSLELLRCKHSCVYFLLRHISIMFIFSRFRFPQDFVTYLSFGNHLLLVLSTHSHDPN